LHLIRRQILELELPREAGALALQRRASRVFQEQVLPRLDEVFSRIAPEGRHVRIERLELDLGDLSEANWEREFVDKCVAKIGHQVAEAAFAVGGLTPTETLNAEENALAVLLYFLQTGMLPWYAKHLTLITLKEMVIRSMAKGSTNPSQELHRILKDHSDAFQRMVWQFGTAFSEKMVENTLGLSNGWIQQAIQIHQSQTGQQWSEQAFLTLTKHLLRTDKSVLKNTPPTPTLLTQVFFSESPIPDSPSLVKVHHDSGSPSLARPIPDVADPDQAEHPWSSKEEIPTLQKTDRPKTDPQGIPIDNAGLVLLAVYLPSFFKKLGIELPHNPESSNNSSLITDSSKAVHLLHFLATGQEHPEEPVLVLPKILCGMKLETPVPQDFDLSDEEKHEASRLLEAIIRNWPVLKNTSPDGLRSAFLQRAGLLSWSESRQSWVLQVERLGQDLLLEKVPWSYSVVKLGWMGEMVQVEW